MKQDKKCQKPEKNIGVKKNTIDLNESNRDYSVFLPSISGFYVGTIQHPETRVPAGFERGIEGLNFLDPDNSYFHYKWGLYSAGHAQLDVAKSDVEELMIQKRDRKNSFILGDSGGFQIITGILKMNWDKFKTDDAVRHKILDYLEHTADYSMTLDVPTLAASEPYSSRNGITSFDQCLEYSKFNNDWFVKHRKGNTKFLNSMQGRTVNEARHWFDEVKDYPFEGFGFGGSTSKNLVVMLKLLIWMRDAGLMQEGQQDWLHFLGVSRVEYASYYTTIKRMLQQTVNPSLDVSYDAASAFIMATKGYQYDNILLNNEKFVASANAVVDDKRYAGSGLPLPNYSPIYERLTAGDLCVYEHGVPDMEALMNAWAAKKAKEQHHLVDAIEDFDLDEVLKDKELLNDPSLWQQQGSKNKIDKVGKTSWDTSSYLYVMAHNVYKAIETIQQVNQTVDLSRTTWTDMDLQEYRMLKTSTKKRAPILDHWTKADVLMTNQIIEQVFTSETPMDVIDGAAGYLDSQSIVKGYADTHNIANQLFDFN
jgi:hypothetical protein